MKSAARFFFLGLASVVLVHCAKGATLGGDPGGDGGGDDTGGEGGGPSSTGNGGATTGNGGATTGNGGATTGSGGTTTGSGGTTTTGSGGNPDASSSSSSSSGDASSSSSSSGSTSSASSTSSSAATTTTTTAASSTSSSSSSTGGGPTDCDPENPGAVCLSSEHCFPTPDGNPVCQGPVGGGGTYSACATPDECQAALNCIDTGDIFALPCCLEWCNSAADCPAGSTCEFLATAVYVGAVEYGVCYDGFGGCL